MVKTVVKKSLKKLLFKLEKRYRFVRDKIYLGYLDVPRKTLVVNFLFQRILRINSETSWSVNYTSRVFLPEKIKIGRNVGISFAVSNGCYIQGGNGIEIGDGTIFGPGVKIISANHDLENISRWKPGKPIIIGKNCWIGANTVILPGVELGDNVTVGAGAIVTKSFSSDVTIAGNPAKIIKEAENIKR